jgi:DUF1680 family protein
MKTRLDGNRHPCVEPVVPNAVEPVMQPVPYDRQHIGGLLGDRIDRNIRDGLLGYPVEVYLNPYRTDWTARWPSGEYLGKYVQADVCMYQYSGSAELMEQLRNIIGTWLEVLPEDGYLVVRGPKEKERWRGAWEVWELKYDLIGLLSFYSISGDERVLAAARRIGDLLCTTFGYGEGQRDLLEAGAHRSGSTSVLEPMTYLYRYTGDKKHFDFCDYIMAAHEQEPNGTRIISELTKRSGEVYGIGGPRIWQMGKAYEMISSFVGVVRMYELTGRREYLDAMLTAWKDIRDNRLFVTGTTSNREYFLHKHILPGEERDLVGEGCVTAHWIFFSRVLFGLTGDPCYIDEVELSTYNALIASQSPHNGHQSYFTPINGKRKFELHTIETPAPPCCISSVAREIARTAEAMWAKPRDGGVAVLLYSSGELQDEVKAADGSTVKLRLEIQTDFPKSGRATLTLRPEHPSTIKLLLRVPAWCTTYRASVGGKSYSGTPGQFLEVTRTWQEGDSVAVEMDVPVRLVPGGDSYPGHFAVKRGPQVLTIDSRLNEGDIGTATMNSSATIALAEAPERLPEGWVGDQAYAASAVTIDGKGPAILVPYADAGQFGGHEYRVWIRDIDAPAERWTRIEDTAPDWKIRGEFTRESQEGASGGSLTRVEDGGTLEIEFTGSQVRVLGMKGPEQGLADIVIDGDRYADVKWYEHRDTHQARILTSRLLHDGKHRMTITAKGRITLDCIEALTLGKQQ